MVTREQAVRRVEELLVEERRRQPHLPELAVIDVDEHELGWLVYWNSVAYARSGALADRLIGQGPYLVDRLDGSVHHVPVVTFIGEPWELVYREQVRGERLPDPLPGTVRELLARAGAVAAMRHLRTVAPQLSLHEVKAYVDGVRERGEPPVALVERTRPRPDQPVLAIGTVAGPIGDATTG